MPSPVFIRFSRFTDIRRRSEALTFVNFAPSAKMLGFVGLSYLRYTVTR